MAGVALVTVIIVGLLVPLVAPLHVTKKLPPSGTAETVTVAPNGIGFGWLNATLPPPTPFVPTTVPNIAWILFVWLIVRVSGLLVPLASPCQPMKLQPLLPTAVSVTALPIGKKVGWDKTGPLTLMLPPPGVVVVKG